MPPGPSEFRPFLGRAKRVGWVASAVLSAFLLGVSPPAAAPAPPERGSPLLVTRMTFVSSRAGRLDLVVEAARARVEIGSELAELEGVRARVLREGNAAGLEITCTRGKFDLGTYDFLAAGDVHGRTGDGREFASDWIRYEHSTGIAYTDAPVQIVEGTRTLRGGGMRYAVREGRLHLLGGTSVVQDP